MTSAGAGRASHVFLTNHKTYPSSVRSQVLAQAKYWPAPIKKMMPDAGSRKNLEGEQGNKIPVWTHSYHLKIYYQMFEYIELEWHNSNKQSNLPAWNHPRLQNNSSHICWDHIARQKKMLSMIHWSHSYYMRSGLWSVRYMTLGGFPSMVRKYNSSQSISKKISSGPLQKALTLPSSAHVSPSKWYIRERHAWDTTWPFSVRSSLM